jgi:hypothetical protein
LGSPARDWAQKGLRIEWGCTQNRLDILRTDWLYSNWVGNTLSTLQQQPV